MENSNVFDRVELEGETLEIELTGWDSTRNLSIKCSLSIQECQVYAMHLSDQYHLRPDVVRWARKNKEDWQVVCGFAMADNRRLNRIQAKLSRAGLTELVEMLRLRRDLLHTIEKERQEAAPSAEPT